MCGVISQTIVLPAPADTLFRMYLDAAEHAAITGAPVTIGDAPGAEFSAFEGALSGVILAIVKPSLIVQSWRSADFQSADPDSTLILSFRPDGDFGRIDLVHLDVPDHDFDAVSGGWRKFYWAPWREYLARNAT